jgi:hypothetical protein
MREHCSTVALDERRQAVNAVSLLVRKHGRGPGGVEPSVRLASWISSTSRTTLTEESRNVSFTVAVSAGVTQLVEYVLPKHAVASSNLVARSTM